MNPTAPLPPGPSSPAAWQLLHYSTRTIPYLESCARRYGTPFTMRLAGYGPLVQITDSAAVRDIFRADPDALHSGEGNEFISITVGENSVLVLDGARHARQRAALGPALRGDRTRAMLEAMHTEAADAVAQWPINQPFKAMPWMRRIALRVILRSALGLPAGPELDHFEKVTESLLSQARSRHTLILVKVIPRAMIKSRLSPYQGLLRAFDREILRLLRERRATPDPTRPANTLDDLIASRDDKGELFSDQEIRDAILTSIVAGYDTTAVALGWALEQIVPRQDVVDAILAEAAASPNPMAKRPYIEATLKEVLRLRTIFPFVVRLTKRPFTAGDRTYPEGVLLCPAIHLIHRREDLYPNPERFDPQRFLTRSYGADEWLPFGGGNRACIGMAFALAEMKIILSTIFTMVRLARPPGAMSRPIRRGIALAPHDECILTLHEKKSATSGNVP